MLYNKLQFKSLDEEAAVTLIEANPFATLVSVIDREPVISHLPLVAERAAKGLKLVGHLARANPHSKILAQVKCTVIFHGFHTYITPKWYKENDVPTWNYSVVHIEGKPKLIEDCEGILKCLKILSTHTEKLWPSGWEFFLPDDLADPLVLEKSIVGFRIDVESLNFKRKLSQNRSVEDQERVVEGLRSRVDDQSRGVLADMRGLKR